MNKSLHIHILLIPKKEISRVMFLKSSGGFIRWHFQMLSTGHLEERLKDGKTAFEELEISGGHGSCGVKSIVQERTLMF